MVTRQELDEAIRECEAAPSSYDICRKLAIFYAVRDHLYGEDNVRTSAAVEPRYEIIAEERIGDYGDSEFLQTVAGRYPADVWAVMDELMETLAVVNPRLYNGVMRRLEK